MTRWRLALALLPCLVGQAAPAHRSMAVVPISVGPEGVMYVQFLT